MFFRKAVSNQTLQTVNLKAKKYPHKIFTSRRSCPKRFYKKDYVKKIPVNFANLLKTTFFSYFIQSRDFLSVAYFTVANLAQFGTISVYCQVSVRSQYLVTLLSQRWITGSHIIHPPMEGLLHPTGVEPTPFRNSVFKVATLQIHATIPGNIEHLR